MSIDFKLTTQEGVISWRRGLLEVRQVYVTDSSEVFCERLQDRRSMGAAADRLGPVGNECVQRSGNVGGRAEVEVCVCVVAERKSSSKKASASPLRQATLRQSPQDSKPKSMR